MILQILLEISVLGARVNWIAFVTENRDSYWPEGFDMEWFFDIINL